MKSVRQIKFMPHTDIIPNQMFYYSAGRNLIQNG